MGCTLGEALITPTRIYADVILDLVEKFKINGMSNITGGGFYENIPRMIPDGLSADIDTKDIQVHPIFKVMQKEGKIDIDEMYSTFNMGIGIVMSVDKNIADNVVKYLKDKGEKPVVLGKIVKRQGEIKICHQ